MTSGKNLYKMILSAMFLALAMVLPLLTGQLQTIGKALCPMHIPVILCGFFCGPVYALLIGFIAPLLRFLLFGMPTIIPKGIAMCFELATYGAMAGLLYKLFPKKKIFICISLVIAMLAGRIVWGTVRVILYGLGESEFGWAAFMSGAFLEAIPGIILQLVLIPILVIMFEKYNEKH